MCFITTQNELEIASVSYLTERLKLTIWSRVEFSGKSTTHAAPCKIVENRYFVWWKYSFIYHNMGKYRLMCRDTYEYIDLLLKVRYHSQYISE